MNPKKLLKRAQGLDLAGKAEEASVAYRTFLDQEPKNADAWADYAGQLIKLGRLDEARRASETALGLDPHQLSARINLGIALMRQDRLAESEKQLRTVLERDPRRMDAQLFLAECLLNKHDLDNARKALEGAAWVEASPRFSPMKALCAELWAILGLALLEVQKFNEADAACNDSLRLDPHNLRAVANLGSIQMAQGHLDEAERMFRRLMAEHPGDENARLLLITSLGRKGEHDLVDREIEAVLRQEPTSFIVHKSVMGTYYSHGRWPEYLAEIERYRKVEPNLAYLDYEQSFADLLFGDMRQGWQRFEARLNISKMLRLSQRTFAQPAWQGEPFAGQTILLWAEQGFGDTLMFLRYVPMVKALGGRVIVEAQSGLLDVAGTCAGADIVIPKGAPWIPFDLQASLMSLPAILQTDLDSIPAEIPYLGIPEVVPHRTEILEILALAQESTRIGLVWAGNPGHGRDVERSLPAALLAPLASLAGVAWVSFQLGRCEIPPLPGLVSLAPLLEDFSDTACALSGMDLVITVDTSVAHLAGAMGIPTLLLLSFQPDYRWMLERSDSPWYPTLRLYRQPTYGDWASVIAQVLSDLSL